MNVPGFSSLFWWSNAHLHCVVLWNNRRQYFQEILCERSGEPGQNLKQTEQKDSNAIAEKGVPAHFVESFPRQVAHKAFL